MKLHPTEQANANLARANRDHEGAPRALTHCGGRYRLRHCAGEGALLFSARALFNSHRVVGPALGGRHDSAVIDSGHCQAPERSKNTHSIAVHAHAKQAGRHALWPRTHSHEAVSPSKPVLEKEAHSES